MADLISFSACSRVVVRREQGLHADLAVQPQRLEQPRRLGEIDRLFLLLLGHEQIGRGEADGFGLRRGQVEIALDVGLVDRRQLLVVDDGVIVAIVFSLELRRQLFRMSDERMNVRLVRRLPVAAGEPEGVAVAHRDLDVIGGREKAVRICLRDERRPGLLEPFLHFLFERRDDLFLFVEIVGLHAALRRLLRHRVKDQLEFASGRRDGRLDRLENVRRRELIHRHRERLLGFAEEGFQFSSSRPPD